MTDLSKLRITVYENNNESSKLADSYQLSAGAVAKRDGNESVSGSNGIVVLPKGNGDVVISKTDYLSRTISNERAVKNSNIYLQKEVNNRPVIQAVWIGETDVYTKEYKVDITSKKSVTLEAEVVWCGDSRSKLYLMQDSRRVEFSENT